MVTAIPDDIRLFGPLKPMRFEARVEDCVVAEGQIPRELHGGFYRIGPTWKRPTRQGFNGFAATDAGTRMATQVFSVPMASGGRWSVGMGDAIIFLSLVILWRWVFPRIAEALDRRQRAIEESIDTAEETRRRAEELLDEYRARLSEAREQAQEIIDRARKAGEAHERESEEEAIRRREHLMERTRREIEAETRRAIQEIRREVADLTVLATEKVTRKTLTDDDQRRLVEEALSELDFSALAPSGQED